MARPTPDDPVRQLRLAQGKSVSKKPRTAPDPASRRRGIVRAPDAITINLAEVEERVNGEIAQSSKTLQAACVALRVKGMTNGEIAAALGISHRHVARAILDARQSAPVNDLDILLDQRAVHLAVDNLVQMLEQGDKDATFRTLEGRGHLRNYQAVKTEGVQTNFTFSVAFEAADAAPRALDVAGQVFGQPRLGPGDGEK